MCVLIGTIETTCQDILTFRLNAVSKCIRLPLALLAVVMLGDLIADGRNLGLVDIVIYPTRRRNKTMVCSSNLKSSTSYAGLRDGLLVHF